MKFLRVDFEQPNNFWKIVFAWKKRKLLATILLDMSEEKPMIDATAVSRVQKWI